MKFQVHNVLELKDKIDVNCKVWQKKKGYLGVVGCKQITAYPLKKSWEGRFPDPREFCGAGVKDADPRCYVSVAGFEHPHVVMVDDYFYNLHIDLI